jgi:hypothetical protein
VKYGREHRMSTSGQICRAAAVALMIAAVLRVGVSLGVASVPGARGAVAETACPQAPAPRTAGHVGDEFGDAEQDLQSKPIEDPIPAF